MLRPYRVTVNGGYVMPAWYDITAMDIDREIDASGLVTSAGRVEDLVEREYRRGIDSTRVIVAGFSQGGAVAYHLGLSYTRPLAGLLAMSSYFATADIVEYNEPNLKIPIQIQHGLYDPVVPEILGRQAADHLSGKGYRVDYQTYPMEHNVCPDQIRAVSMWIQRTLRCSS
jgi:phospholipase/carboxylesterase